MAGCRPFDPDRVPFYYGWAGHWMSVGHRGRLASVLLRPVGVLSNQGANPWARRTISSPVGSIPMVPITPDAQSHPWWH